MQPCGARAAQETTRGAQFPEHARAGAVKGRVRLVARLGSRQSPWLCLYSLNGSKIGGVGFKKGAKGDILPYSPLLDKAVPKGTRRGR
jgi:hypothetical protein